jgi:hypothetical protein
MISEKVKVVCLFILNAILSYNVYRQGKAFYDSRIEQEKLTPKVFDIGMKYIPDNSHNKNLAFIINILPVILPIILFIKTPYLTHFYYILTYVFLLRHIFLNLTILPKNKTCKDETYSIENIFSGHCYSKIFSGHFAVMFLIALFLYKYNIFTNTLLLGSTLFIYAIAVISLRLNYTIDIAVAILATFSIFTLVG